MSVATRVPDDFRDIKVEVHPRRERGGPKAKRGSQRSSREEGGDYSPPGSPPNLDREPSVHQLYRSARNSFGGRLEPLAGLEVLDHPVKRSSSRVVAQDWQIEEESTIAGERTQERGAATCSKESFGRKIVRGVCDREREKIPWVGRSMEGAGDSQLSVVASAPGKVILFGEHAVVYGRTAVAAAVSDLRIVVTARTTEEADLCIDLPDLKEPDGLPICFRRPMADILSYFAIKLMGGRSAPTPPTAAHLESISNFIGDELLPENKKALLPLVFLILGIMPHVLLANPRSRKTRGLRLEAYSASLPIGAGLGSSAALCVASSAALTQLATLITCGGTSEGDASVTALGRRPSSSELEEINAWAFAGETVLHGTPSGLDNTVSSFGGAIKFIRGMNGKSSITEPIAGFPPLPTLLTNTLVPRETRRLVAGVRKLLEAHPNSTTAVFDAIGAIAVEFLERAALSAAAMVESAAAAVETIAAGYDADALAGGSTVGAATRGALTAELVGELAEMNHHLLCALGVGHPTLERVCAIGKDHGCKTKLTGAGGGGCAVTILGPKAVNSRKSLVEDMVAEGFLCYESSLGGAGVLLHDEGIPPPLARNTQAVKKARALDEPPSTATSSGFRGLFGGGKIMGITSLALMATVTTVAAFSLCLAPRRGRNYSY